MYFECCPGTQSIQNSIRSAISDDGLEWEVEQDARLELDSCNLTSPRILFLADGQCRMFCGAQGRGIISAISNDGLTFEVEPGTRIAPGDTLDRAVAFAAEIIRLDDGYRMYYAGYSKPQRADILTATSADGIHWQKDETPVLSPGSKPWDAVKCSEMCIIRVADQFHMFYEACDGTAADQRGVWRIAHAVCDV